MNNLWLKIKVWTKITIFGLGALYLLVFIYKNTGEDRAVKFWWWINSESPTSVFVLALISFFVGILATLLARTTWVTYRQVQNVQNRNRSNRLEREMAEMKAKSAMLQTRTVSAQIVSPVESTERVP